MYLAQKNGWQFWTNLHPASVECAEDDKNGNCLCEYHIISSDQKTIYSFQVGEYAKAAQKFADLTKEVPFTIKSLNV